MNNKPRLRFKDKNGNAYPEWEEKAMEHFGTFLKGNNLSKADLTSNGYPCILYGELYTKYSEITEKIHSYTDRLETNQTIGNMNDVLIPSSGETAIDISTATCLLVNYVLLGGDLNVFRPKEQDGRFISYELNHKKRRKIASIAQGATVVHLYPNFLKKLKITLPCLEEQEKIAGFLSKVDELINECEGEVKDLEEQKKGLMQKIFSQQIRFKDFNNNHYPDWEEKKIRDISVVITGNTPKTSEQDNYGDKYLWCSPVDLGNEKYIKKTEKMLSEKGISKSRKIPKGSILVTCIGSTIGKIGFATEIMATNQQINSMLIKKENNEYIYYSLLYNFPKYMSFVSKQAVPIINKTQFENLKIDIPCLEEQEKIAKVLSKMDELIEEKKALLSDWQQFKKGLLQQMFV